AAMPRAAELGDPVVANRQRATWHGLLRGSAVVLIVLQSASVIFLLVTAVQSRWMSGGTLFNILLVGLVVLVLTGLITIRPVHGAVKGDLAWRDIAIALGAATALW